MVKNITLALLIISMMFVGIAWGQETIEQVKAKAQAGDAMAQCVLGVCYLEGRVVEENQTEAVKWFRKAAAQGSDFAQASLGECYLYGRGLEQNDEQAKKWLFMAFESARRNGNKDVQSKVLTLIQRRKWNVGSKPNNSQSLVSKVAPDSRYYSHVKSNLFIITTDTGAGSGFLANINGGKYLVTNCHVLEGAKEVKVCEADGQHIDTIGFKKKSIKIELADNEDLIRMLTESCQGIGLSISSNSAVMGETVVVYGNSQGEGVITECNGKVLGVGSGKVEVDAGFVGGNSGSPIISLKSGAVVGVATYVQLEPKPSWVTEGTRFGEVRRYGIDVNNRIKWIPTTSTQFFEQSILLLDTERVLYDLFQVLVVLETADKEKSFDDKWKKIKILMPQLERSIRAADNLENKDWQRRICSYFSTYNSMYSSASSKNILTDLTTKCFSMLDKTKWLTNRMKERAKNDAEVLKAIFTYREAW